LPSASHPTQIFLHNPQALRVEYRLDDGRLILWWSPLAGKSAAARDRNFSNRDDHLHVFDRIALPGCGLAGFVSCDYDPYHTTLHFQRQVLHLAVRHDAAALLLWAEKPQEVDFKTERYDEVISTAPRSWAVRHAEPVHTFEFAACLGAGTGEFRFSNIHAPGNSHYAQARMAAGQLLTIGVGLQGEGTAPHTAEISDAGVADNLQQIESALAPQVECGKITAEAHADMIRLRAGVIRGLHSMIDESGAFRASLKAIYYLIWVRDAAFTFHYQAAAGWTHKLEELCGLLLANPTRARGEGIPPGRMFGQLINPDYGKHEEDGAFYVIWAVFTHWTQTGSRRFTGPDSLALLGEAVDWVERYAFDAGRGLFGGRFADETPALHARDYGWDYAIGKPAGDEHIQHEGRRVVRSYDIYLNTLMHSAYTMLAAMSEGGAAAGYAARAAGLQKNLAAFYADRRDGLPAYGDLISESGETLRVHRWGPASSVYVWALAIPNFLPCEDRDAMQMALLDALMEKPAMHWINGICAAVAAADPWVHGESRLLAILLQIKDEAMKPGPFLPMAGAMPEKFDAPQGDLYHDIRPQGFAMGAWLGAWASLGVRRLPFGLALRPTFAYEKLENYPWHGKILDFGFDARGTEAALLINGRPVPATLQIPEEELDRERNEVRLVATTAQTVPLWLRSTVRLERVGMRKNLIEWEFTAFGLAEITVKDLPEQVRVERADKTALEVQREDRAGLTTLRFDWQGRGTLRVDVN